MKILKPIIFNKLALQAEEAKIQGFTKLAQAIESSIGEEAIVDDVTYSYNQLKEDVYKDLWNVAAKLIKYYNLDSVDALKINKELETYAEKLINDLEVTLNVDDKVQGTTEDIVPGEFD